MSTEEKLDDLIRDNRNPSDKDFIEQLLIFEQNSFDQCDNVRFEIYLNLSNSYSIDSKEQDLDRAMEYNKYAEAFIHESSDQQKAKLYHVKGHIYARKKDDKNSREAFIKHIFYQCKNSSEFKTPFGIQSQIIKLKKSFYSFRTVNEIGRAHV